MGQAQQSHSCLVSTKQHISLLLLCVFFYSLSAPDSRTYNISEQRKAVATTLLKYQIR